MTLEPDPELDRLQRRLEREQRSRREAERIAEQVTGEMYAAKMELEKLNAELLRTNDELQAVNQSMRDFVAVASHDLRGPITAIIGYVDLLIRRADVMDDVRRADALETIQRQGKHLARMVEDLLTISRIEAGALAVHHDVVELRRALNEMMTDFAARNAEVEIESPPTLTVLVDPDHLRRIVVNFVGNAFKYGEPPVQVVASEAGDWVEIRVRDCGDGVPEDFRPRLFNRFARSGATPRNGETSTGLGLAIVQGLAEANGGLVWYEPNLPRGSVFGVRLPRSAA